MEKTITGKTHLFCCAPAFPLKFDPPMYSFPYAGAPGICALRGNVENFCAFP